MCGSSRWQVYSHTRRPCCSYLLICVGTNQNTKGSWAKPVCLRTWASASSEMPIKLICFPLLRKHEAHSKGSRKSKQRQARANPNNHKAMTKRQLANTIQNRNCYQRPKRAKRGRSAHSHTHTQPLMRNHVMKTKTKQGTVEVEARNQSQHVLLLRYRQVCVRKLVLVCVCVMQLWENAEAGGTKTAHVYECHLCECDCNSFGSPALLLLFFQEYFGSYWETHMNVYTYVCIYALILNTIAPLKT